MAPVTSRRSFQVTPHQLCMQRPTFASVPSERLRISSACALGALRSATSVVVLPIVASAGPVLMASATTAASNLINALMRVPPRPFYLGASSVQFHHHCE